LEEVPEVVLSLQKVADFLHFPAVFQQKLLSLFQPYNPSL